MNKNPPVLIELGLYKSDRRDQVLENISLLHVIQGNLVSNEGLSSEELGISADTIDLPHAYFRDKELSPH